MPDAERAEESCPSGDFDYSTVEAQRALAGVSDLVLEVRDEVDRRNRLYERTLGLAVVPVLVKRGAGRLWRRWKAGRRSTP